MPRRVKISVDPNGGIKLETEGFKGKTCMTEAEKILRGLEESGVRVTTSKVVPTKEYYQQTTQQEEVNA